MTGSSKLFKVAMTFPTGSHCGVADYTNLLTERIAPLPEVESVARIPILPIEKAKSLFSIAHGIEINKRIVANGRELNIGDIAHIQFQYFFFGGVSPLKNRFNEFIHQVEVPTVMTLHEIARPEVGASKITVAGIDVTNSRIFRNKKIGAFIVHTDADRKLLLQYHVEEKNIHLLLHPVPKALQAPSKEDAKRELGLTGRKTVTLFGFLSRKKGHLVALDALKELPQNVVLIFAGEKHPEDSTEYVPQLKRQIEESGLSNRVVITGYLESDKVPVVMAATDIAIAPFLHTSGSGSLANYFAYGLPVVASNIKPHQDLLEANPDSMALFPAGDAKLLAENLSVAFNIDSVRDKLIDGAIRFARTHSYLDMAKKTVKIYQSLLETA